MQIQIQTSYGPKFLHGTQTVMAALFSLILKRENKLAEYSIRHQSIVNILLNTGQREATKLIRSNTYYCITSMLSLLAKFQNCHLACMFCLLCMGIVVYIIRKVRPEDVSSFDSVSGSTKDRYFVLLVH